MRRGTRSCRGACSRARPAIWLLPRATALLLLLVGCQTSSPLQAPQVTERSGPAHVGIVHLFPETVAPVVVGLRVGLSELGYTEGRDIVLEIRSGPGDYETALKATRELNDLNVAVLVSAGTVATQAAKDAAGDIPVVFTQVGEPIAASFVETFRRPGGRMTGFTHLLPEATGKRLQLLLAIAPAVRRVLVIYSPINPSSVEAAAVAREAASVLGVRLLERQVASGDEVLMIVDHLDTDIVDAILILPDSLVVNLGNVIIERAAEARIPVMFHEAEWVERGGLASYGASFVELGRQAASYVDKILKGTRPGDLPVQQPTGFELALNLRTAEALGLSVAASMIAESARVVR